MIVVLQALDAIFSTEMSVGAFALCASSLGKSTTVGQIIEDFQKFDSFVEGIACATDRAVAFGFASSRVASTKRQSSHLDTKYEFERNPKDPVKEITLRWQLTLQWQLIRPKLLTSQLQPIRYGSPL